MEAVQAENLPVDRPLLAPERLGEGAWGSGETIVPLFDDRTDERFISVDESAEVGTANAATDFRNRGREWGKGLTLGALPPVH